jgi:hypothetical protein
LAFKPNLFNSRAQWCEPEHASIAIGGVLNFV